MTAADNDLTFRQITGPDELDLFTRLPYVLNAELADDLDSRRRQPNWLWLAMRGDHLVARAAWWARPGSTVPAVLDILDIDDSGRPDTAEIAARLLRTAMAEVIPPGVRPPEYSRFVPPGWRDDPASQRVVADRMSAAERTGARFFVERLRLDWRPGTPIPEPTGRLAFRQVGDHGELVDLMTQVMAGTLDAHGRRDLASMSPEQAAAKHYEGELARYTSPRDWWRIAVRPGGEPVGFVIPAHNGYNPIIAYLGVLPAHRGNGYVSEILAEGTRILLAHDVPRIRATTDLGNGPMAGAFLRAGWIAFEHVINMTWSQPPGP